MEYKMVTCPKCGRGYSVNDFFGREICYKCCYTMKNVKWPDPKVLKDVILCEICGNCVPAHRRKYCTEYCAGQGLNKRRMKFWVNDLKDKENSWKKEGFDFRRQEP